MQGRHVQMVENAVGYKFKNTDGPTPATGTTFEIKATQNDWQNDVTANAGGGGDYGCCPISNMFFMNISTGLRSRGFQGIYSFQKTTDNGISWNTFASPISFAPKQIVMVNDTTGYLSGNSYGANHAQLYRLTPTASQQLLDWDSLFFTDAKIEFPNSNNGFIIVGDTNQRTHLYRSNDSGVSWTKVFSSNLNVLTSTSFTDSLKGYICANNGEIHKTTDGGMNWAIVPGPGPNANSINSVDFFDDQVGYIVGDSGKIHKTTDGALSWTSEVSGTTSNLMEVQMVDINTAYSIGHDGALLKNGPVLAVESSSNNPTSSTIIYPNPASNSISINVQPRLTLQTVELFDAKGRLVLSENHSEVDVSALGSGMYLVKVHADRRIYTSKLIKE